MTNYIQMFDSKGMTYQLYRTLIDRLLTEGKTTGPDHSPEMLAYTKLNVQRMNRLDKTVKFSEELINAVTRITRPVQLLIITEGWCGDAAQIVPVFNQLEVEFPEKISIRYLLRDQNLEITDQFLTNGGRAIPIILLLGDNEVKKWGPRPPELQALLGQWKQETTDMMILAEKLHGWYAKDKTQSTQKAIIELLSFAV